jgi:hypothetical protein
MKIYCWTLVYFVNEVSIPERGKTVHVSLNIYPEALLGAGEVILYSIQY